METIKLDLIPGKKMPSLHASQYDDGREHGIDLFENGVAYKLDGTETLTINERKGDDCICSLDIENTFADSNHIVFASTEQMCAVWGNNICELVIAKGEKTIGTLNFILEIEPSPTEGGIESESEIKNLKRQVEAITEEVIGDDYYTKTQTDDAIATAIEGKADTTYVNTELAKKADKTDTYTKSQTDNLLNDKANASDVYTKQATDALLNDKADVSDLPDMSQYYDKSEVDDLLNDKANSDDVYGKTQINTIVSGIDSVLEGKADKGTTYTKEQVDDIVYNILPDDTASGSVADFETDLALPLKSLEIDVNAKQDLHGYDYPWTGGGGKNLLKTSGLSLVPPSDTTFSNVTKRTFASNCFCTGLSANNYYQGNKVSQYDVSENFISVTTSATAYAILIPVTGLVVGETYTLSATADKGNFTVGFWQEDGTYISSANVSITKVTFVVPENTHWVGLTFRPIDANIQATYTNIQLEKGSTATEYAPYENICPIEGWSAISLVNCGANLWNEEWEQGTYDTTTGEKATSTMLKRNIEPISVKENTAYTRVKTQTGVLLACRLFFYDADMNLLATEVNTSDIYSFTTPVGCSFLNFDFQNNITALSVNYPATDTTYHTYNGNTEVINLGGAYYGGHFTQDKAGHRQLEVTHGIKLFGDISFSRSNNSGAWQSYLFYAQISDKVNGGVLKCSNYEYVIQTTSTMQNEKIVSVGSSKYIYVRDDNYTTVADFKTANANTQLVYPLATPIIIDLPDGEPIITLNGTNNIYADTGDCAVEYKCSVAEYVANHSGGGGAKSLGGVFLGGSNSGSEEEPTEESENTEKVKLDETKVEINAIGDDSNIKKLGGD